MNFLIVLGWLTLVWLAGFFSGRVYEIDKLTKDLEKLRNKIQQEQVSSLTQK
jgi:hypothetical protein